MIFCPQTWLRLSWLLELFHQTSKNHLKYVCNMSQGTSSLSNHFSRVQSVKWRQRKLDLDYLNEIFKRLSLEMNHHILLLVDQYYDKVCSPMYKGLKWVCLFRLSKHVRSLYSMITTSSFFQVTINKASQQIDYLKVSLLLKRFKFFLCFKSSFSISDQIQAQDFNILFDASKSFLIIF